MRPSAAVVSEGLRHSDRGRRESEGSGRSEPVVGIDVPFVAKGVEPAPSVRDWVPVRPAAAVFLHSRMAANCGGTLMSAGTRIDDEELSGQRVFRIAAAAAVPTAGRARFPVHSTGSVGPLKCVSL